MTVLKESALPHMVDRRREKPRVGNVKAEWNPWAKALQGLCKAQERYWDKGKEAGMWSEQL